MSSAADPSAVIRIGLTDDQPLFRAGIAMVVNSQPDLERGVGGLRRRRGRGPLRRPSRSTWC